MPKQQRPVSVTKSQRISTSVASTTRPEGKRKFTSTRQIINTFHELNKRLISASDDQKRDLQRQIEEIGGLHVYQRASLKGARKGGGYSSSWLVKTLKKLDLLPKVL
jgi:hypothetical protein